MRRFGELGFTTNRAEIKSKLADRLHKVMFLRYAEEHDGDCYRLYKIGTKRVILSRDVRWADKMMLKLEQIEKKCHANLHVSTMVLEPNASSLGSFSTRHTC